MMRSVLAGHIVREEPEHAFAHFAFGDGEADVYLSDDHMMANHVDGEEPWDLLVRGARAADWVIMPLDRPVLITDKSQREHLPDGLGDGARHVLTGEDVLRALREA